MIAIQGRRALTRLLLVQISSEASLFSSYWAYSKRWKFFYEKVQISRRGDSSNSIFTIFFLLGQLASLMPPTHLPSTPVFPSDNQPPLRFTGYSENLCRFWIKWETWFILEYFLWKKFFRFKNIHLYQRYIFDFRGGVSLSPLLSFPQVFRVFLSGGRTEFVWPTNWYCRF